MDTLNLTILEDGTITVRTSAISDGNHMSADALLTQLDTLMGGHVTKQKNPDAHKLAHLHGHAHTHAHAGGGH